MTINQKYQELITQLPPKGCFNSFKLFDGNQIRLAVNTSGELNVLIPTGKFDTSHFSTINLSNITIIPSINCKVHEKEIVVDDVFTILNFKSTDKQLQNYFLKVIHSVFEDFPDNPTVKIVLDTIFFLVEIFRYISESPRKSVLGLWGELFFIAISQDSEYLLNIWHNDIYEYLDFSLPNHFYEIKTTTNENRIHSFSSQQLGLRKNGFVVSIITRQLTGGVSINDLINMIKSKTDNQRLISKMTQVVSQTLGREIINSHDNKWDFEMAKETIRFYNITDIPNIKIQNIPSEVFDVKYKVNLTDIVFEKIDGSIPISLSLHQ